MEKRLVIFLLLSVLILTGHVMIRNLFFPPPHPVARQADGLGDDKRDQQQKKDEDKKAMREGTGKGAQADGQPGAEPSAKKTGKEQPSEVAEALPDAAAKTLPSPDELPPEPAPLPQEWVTLGTFAPASQHRLLVTFDNRGASIERVEMVARDAKGRLRYRDLGKPYGYLGLQGRDTPDGCVVKVVGPGTPAALAKPNDGSMPAGFAVDDVVVGIVVGANVIPIDSCDELESNLAGTKPDRSVTFLVKRDAKDVQLTTILDHWPLQLVQPESVDDVSAIPSYLMGLHSLGTTVIAQDADELAGIASLRNGTWHVAQPKETEIVFTRRVKVGQGDETGELEFVKRFRLGSPAASDQSPLTFSEYNLQLDIEIHNLGAIPRTVAYALDGPNGLPLEGWWYTNKIHPSWGAAGARDVIWRVHGNRHSLRSASQIYKLVKDDPANPLTSVLTDNPAAAERTLDYLGVDTQYFAAVLMAGTMVEPKAFTCQDVYAMPVGPIPDLTSRGTKTLNTSFRMVSVATPIEPGTTLTDQFHLFLGPKDPEALTDYDLADINEYGWFGKIARPLSWLLHLFYGIFRNYGLAIILLTVLVRGAMFPIGRKAARNAQIMQELAPEIKKIKEKYKNDLEKQGQAQRELWKKHNFNPLSGCWLMFLQLPIFIGLYRCLSVDINLRQAPLIPGIQWCSNLAGPDMAWRWQGLLPDFLAGETGWLGPYLNILPIITIVLFIAQQKMFTPPATDEQTQMQQKMMKYMMIFMGVLFFKVPAGLCVYFIASSLWGIGERKLLPKPGHVPTKPAPEKKSWLQRLRDKAEPDAAEAARQRRKRRRP